jgi:tRNA dimethylallyltransferase
MNVVSAYNLITILGPTASGKTAIAAHVAARLEGEVISADSRQVYRGMDLGTGKDYDDYIVNGRKIPFHLVDIVEAGYQYNVYEYQRDFTKAFEDLQHRRVFPVLCGGSGLYLEAVLKNYRLIQVPHNDILRNKLAGKSLEELTAILRKSKSKLHNITDLENTKRALRAIEIEEYYRNHPQVEPRMPRINSLMIGVKYDRTSQRRRITERLKQRLGKGLVDEVTRLLNEGLSPQALTYYGLEYKFITLYLKGELSYDDMFVKLNTAIHQFAKRQMTWFRRMERQGVTIHWLDGYLPLEEKTERIVSFLYDE